MHPNLKLLSNSGLDELHGCPRKFELDRMLPQQENTDFHKEFGKAVGLGVQEVLTHGSLERATFAMFLAWKELDLFYGFEADYEISSDWKKAIAKKKTFFHALIAVDKFLLPRKTVFANMEIALLNGRPATEIGFSIDCGDGFFYRGFIDGVLLDKTRKELVVVENKTTGFSNVHEANYKHSGQALGYSLIIDMIIHELGMEEASSYKVYYPVYQSSSMEWEVFCFTKTHTRRAMWIRSILLDIRHLVEYHDEGYFPMYGNHCYSFFNPCPHFGRCEFGNEVLFNLANVKEKVEEKHKYDFHFSLEKIVEQQLGKGGAS